MFQSIYHVSVSPTNGNGPTQGQRKTLTRRAFLKRPENFSGPKAFRGFFRVIFSGPGKCFSKPPETARIPSERFGIFLGLAHGRHRAVIRGKERGLTKRLEIDFGNVF